MRPAEELSRSAQDYVKVVWNAYEWSEEPVTVTQIADRLGVGRPTASDQVKRLTVDGLLTHAPYGAIELTPLGNECAVAMVRRHRLIESFLVDTLGYGWDEVHDEAEVLEHACSARMIEAIAATLGDPAVDPHGDPIPRADGTVERLEAVALAEAEPGAWRVARVSDRDPAHLRELAAAGAVPQARIEVDDRGFRVAGAPADLDEALGAVLWVTRD